LNINVSVSVYKGKERVQEKSNECQLHFWVILLNYKSSLFTVLKDTYIERDFE